MEKRARYFEDLLIFIIKVNRHENCEAADELGKREKSPPISRAQAIANTKENTKINIYSDRCVCACVFMLLVCQIKMMIYDFYQMNLFRFLIERNYDSNCPSQNTHEYAAGFVLFSHYQ